MAIAAVEQNRISELAETNEIKKKRESYQRCNEATYADGGIASLSSMLLGVCDRKLYIGEEADIYYDILDTRDYLKEKYDELSDIEAIKHKKDVEEALDEADAVLNYIESRFNR